MTGIFQIRICLLWIGILFITEHAYSLSITSIQESSNSGVPTLKLHLSEPHKLTIDQEDASTILVELPSGAEWKPALSGTFNAGFKNYSYTPYKNGGGDLLIKIDPHFTVDKFGTAPNGIFGISLKPPAGPSTSPNSSAALTISNVQIGPKLNNTRVVFDLNRSGAFKITESPNGQKILVIPLEPTQWRAPASFERENGVFKNYRLVAVGKDVGVEINTLPGTHLLNASIMNPKSDAPKLVIDMGQQPFVPGVVSPPKEESPSSARALLEKKNAPVSSPIVKKMTITNQGDETIVRFSINRPIEFHVAENMVTKEITVEMPKTDWSTTEVPRVSGGLINNFKVDQSPESLTKITFHVRPETKIIDKKLISHGADSRFIIILSQGSDKTPTWLVDSSDSYLTLSKVNKAEAETSIITYRGGIAPFMNIGEGIYVGAGIGQAGTENNSHSNFNGNSFTMPQSDLGVNGRVLAGYGLAFDRYYMGLEVGATLNAATDKESFQAGAADLHETFEMKSSWDTALRLGYYISPSTLFYGKLGCASTHFSLNAKDHGGQVGSYSKQGTSGFIFGLGFESSLNDQLTLRLEGSQTNYQPIRLVGTNYNRKDRIIMNQVFGGLSYKISPMMGPAAQDLYDESISTGWYFGANTGFKTLTDARSVHGSLNASPTVYDARDATIEPAWGVYGGYSTIKDRVYYAGELEFDLNPTVIKGQMSTSTRSETYTNKISWLTALVGRLGYVFNFGTVGYGTLGVVTGRVTHSASVSDTNRVTTSARPQKTMLTGIRAGAGIEAFLTRHLSLRSDYTFDYFPAVTFSDGKARDKNTFTNSEFKVGLSYILNP